jgi:hypothetical protein
MPEKISTEIVEPEEKPTQIDFNPLDEQVNEKPYTIPNVNTTGVDMNAPIEEPRFSPPPIDKIKRDTPKPPPRDPINPEMKHLGKKDTDMAAGYAAKLIMQGYEWMHELGNRFLQVSEKKLNKLQADGEINLNAMIDYDYGKKIRAGEFFKEYNNQNKDLLQVSDEFKAEAMPLLEKVLAKRGIGMTDEQMLIFVFGKDIAAKTMIIFQQKAQMNMMIASIKEATTGMYAQAPPPPPPPPQPTETQEPARQPEPEIFATEPEENLQLKKRGRPAKKTEISL